jgi:S-adenosylmethionine:tRNA-ribosyltransferase-isomerase (queuine synthetase)
MTAATESFELDDLNYDLPDELIAQKPLPVRHESRLLKVDRKNQTIAHHVFSDIVELLNAGDVLVVNDTKVIPSRLYAERKSGGIVRFLLLHPAAGAPNIWEAMVTPIKRIKIGEKLNLLSSDGLQHEITVADIILDKDGFKRLLVDLGAKEDVYHLLNTYGWAPLPPYIVREKPVGSARPDERVSARPAGNASQQAEKSASEQSEKSASEPNGETEDNDAEKEPRDAAEYARFEELRLAQRELHNFDIDRYQTVFANDPGAVAAPTAGLHFSQETLAALKAKGVEVHKVTLHVGTGTFKPIETNVQEHTLEPEEYRVSKETADAVNKARREGRRVIAVGTTSMRTLETAGASGSVEATSNGTSSLYIKPGYKFKIVDAMVTNFHLSKSSLLVLVACFAGKDLILKAYNEAVEKRYRFFSYGDAMLIL